MTKTKERILLTSAKLLAKNPGISVSEIAIEAQVGRATLHRHFPKREDLLNDLVIFVLEKTYSITEEVIALDISAKSRLEAIIQKFIPMGDLFHFLMTDTTLYSNQKAQKMYQKQLDGMMHLVEQAKQDGDISGNVSTSWVVYALDALLYSAWQGINDGYIAVNDATAFVTGTLFHGISNPPVDAFSPRPYKL